MKSAVEKSRRAVALLAGGIVMMSVASVSSSTYVDCTPLMSHVCRPEYSMPHGYEFTQGINYWAVVGVAPTYLEDKDIYVYPSCGSGAPLASSTGTNGLDFVVGDFNHTALGTYYPTVTYGDPTAYYNVYWRNGGAIGPIGSTISGELGGTLAGCNMIQIFDVFLEQNREYRFSFRTDFYPSGKAAIFRNPSASAYWAGRSAGVFELATDEYTVYTAPATDWYGLVVFPQWILPGAGNFQIHVERLDDCIALSSGVCVNNKLYSPATGPANDYTCTQQVAHWTAVALLPDALDDKALGVSGSCDGDDYILRGDVAGAGGTEIIVGDYNHAALDQFHPRVEGGGVDLDYSIQWDDGADILSVPGWSFGSMTGLDPGSVCVKIWDVHLEEGKQYEFHFYTYGEKAPHAALFRNPTKTEYWAHLGLSEWEMSAEGYKTYTAPATDWYGLVVYASQRRENTSTYGITIDPLNDCEPLTSMNCESFTGLPRDFSITRTAPYWSAAALAPTAEENRGLGVFSQCDGNGDFLVYSEGEGTQLVVADFNHTPFGTYYPRTPEGNNDTPYTVSCDTGNDVFPSDIAVEGTVGGTTGECGAVRIWDVMLSAGTTYRISFTRGGPADVRLSLFRNPGSGTYWAGRYDAVREYSESGNYSYTAPASDWYGLVVFPNVRSKTGNYSVRISNESATGIEPEPLVPGTFALYQNTPNPFNPTTAIRYDVPLGGGKVTLRVFDVSGKLVRTLVDRVESQGEKTVRWDGMDDNGNHTASGVYFCRMTAPAYVETRKMILLQ